MKLSSLMLCSLLLVASCGKKVAYSDRELSMSKVSTLIDRGEFESAIKILEAQRAKSRHDIEINTKLLHALAGAGGFEALKAVSIAKEVETQFKDFKAHTEAQGEKELQKQAESLFAQLEKALEPIPLLTLEQRKRLDQAIDLYSEVGMTLDSAGKYNNFKWGTLHVWRLAITIKDMITEMKLLSAEKLDLKKIEKIILPRLDSIGQDMFKSYQLYSHSFDKIKKFTDTIDRVVAKTINQKDFKLKVNVLAQSEGEFYESLVKDNVRAAAAILNKLSGIYQEKGYAQGIKDSRDKNLPSEAELKESAKKIEMLIRVAVENFSKENQEIESKLKSIFTENLKKELVEAVKFSVKAKNSKPLQDLMELKQPELEIIKAYYQLLSKEIKESDLEENIRAEVDVLDKKVHLEMLKAELSELSKKFNEDVSGLGTDVDAVLKQNAEKDKAHREQVNTQVKELEDYLDNLSGELQESLKGKNPDKAKMEKISKQTKELVES